MKAKSTRIPKGISKNDRKHYFEQWTVGRERCRDQGEYIEGDSIAIVKVDRPIQSINTSPVRLFSKYVYYLTESIEKWEVMKKCIILYFPKLKLNDLK